MLHNFTALVGIVLQDVPAPFHGNLIAYPGSHWVVGEYVQGGKLHDVEQKGQDGFPHHMAFAEPVQVGFPRGKAFHLLITFLVFVGSRFWTRVTFL